MLLLENQEFPDLRRFLDGFFRGANIAPLDRSQYFLVRIGRFKTEIAVLGETLRNEGTEILHDKPIDGFQRSIPPSSSQHRVDLKIPF